MAENAAEAQQDQQQKLWNAIRDDDTAALDTFVLQAKNNREDWLLEVRDEEERDILQSAARVNSHQVLKLLLQRLYGSSGSYDRLVDALRQQLVNGGRQTALHVAVEAKAYSATHQILSTLNRAQLQEGLQISNQDGDTAEELARKLEDRMSVTVIESE